MSIQYTVLGFKPMTFSLESPPITTRPGRLPPLPSLSLKMNAADYYYYYY